MMATFPRGHHARHVRRQPAHQKTRQRHELELGDTTTRDKTILQLIARDGARCYLCHAALSRSLQVEHIIPRIHGGTNALENLALACQSCNCSKGDRIVSIAVPDRTPCYWISR